MISVVIVEDDEKIAEIQRRYLERIDGFELVGLAQNLETARELVDVLEPQLLLLDVYFPEGTGLQFLRDLRSTNNEIDVILITAAREVDTFKAAMRGGVFDFIVKPLVFDRLAETLDRYQQHLAQLQDLEAVAQPVVDQLLPRSSGQVSQQAERLPKGVDGLTLEKVRGAFNHVETGRRNTNLLISADEMGELIGASRTTARRYLEYLISTGELVADVSYGSVGRPERRYKLR